MPDEVVAWICVGADETVAEAVRRGARLHATRREAREERRSRASPRSVRVVSVQVRVRPSSRRRAPAFRRYAEGSWTWIRCATCGYEGEMVDVFQCAHCDGILCGRACCEKHDCRGRLPPPRPVSGAAEARAALLATAARSPPRRDHPPVAVAAQKRDFVRHAEGTWTRIRCVACGYVGEMIDVFRCALCDGVLCGRKCRDAHDCRGRRPSP